LENKIFNPERLLFARRLRSYSRAQLANLTGFSQRFIAYLEEGERIPSNETLIKLANALKVRSNFFYGESLPELDEKGVNFRAPSRTLQSLKRRLLCIASLSINFVEVVQKFLRLPFPNLPDLEGIEPEVAAEALREVWGLGVKPIGKLIPWFEKNGILVFSLPFGDETFDGFSFWYGNRAYIFVNTTRSIERIRFDLVHELGHLVLHRSSGARGIEMEREANSFASAFLMPKSGILGSINGPVSFEGLFKLKKVWRVSMVALIRRLYNVGLITHWRYQSLCKYCAKNQYFHKEPDPLPREEYAETSRLWPVVFKVLKNSNVSLSILSQKMGVYLEEIFSFLRGLVLTVVK